MTLRPMSNGRRHTSRASRTRGRGSPTARPVWIYEGALLLFTEFLVTIGILHTNENKEGKMTKYPRLSRAGECDSSRRPRMKRACTKITVRGSAQSSGQLQGFKRDFQSKCWAKSRNLGPTLYDFRSVRAAVSATGLTLRNLAPKSR